MLPVFLRKGNMVSKPSRSKTKPTPSRVSANVAHKIMAVPKGWETQTCQLGGVPAIAVYREGRFKRLTALQTPTWLPTRQDGPKTACKRLPKASWRTDDHAVVGQLRNGVFEALAISTLTNRTLLAVHGLAAFHDTPSSRVPTVSTDACDKPISVLVTLYPKGLVIHWYDRENGKRLYTLRFKRSADHPIYNKPLDTRASKG